MTELDERIAIDPALVAQLRDQVAGELTRIRQDREQRGAPELGRADEDQLTISVITSVVERHQTRAVMAGADLPDNALYDIALIDQLSKAILKSGRLSDLLEDPDVENVDVNGCDEVWVTYAGRGKVRGVPVAATDAELISMVQDLAAYQGINARPFSRAHPELDLRLGDGSRLSAVLGASERPVVSIRRNRFPEMFLHQLIELESIDDEIATFLQAAVRSRMNLVVAGETNAGKTTLLRACINCIPAQEERILTIERSLELGLRRQGRHRDVVEWEEVLPDTEGQGGISIQKLVLRSRRHNPDRVVVGEVLGPEVVEMLSAMSQGNDGSLSTLHARSAMNVFGKLALYARQYEGIDDAVAHTLVADSIDFVVFVARDRKTNRRCVTEIREVVGAPDGRVASTEIFGRSRRFGCATRNDEYAISEERADLLAVEGYTDTGGGYVFEPRYEIP